MAWLNNETAIVQTSTYVHLPKYAIVDANLDHCILYRLIAK